MLVPGWCATVQLCNEQRISTILIVGIRTLLPTETMGYVLNFIVKLAVIDRKSTRLNSSH